MWEEGDGEFSTGRFHLNLPGAPLLAAVGLHVMVWTPLLVAEIALTVFLLLSQITPIISVCPEETCNPMQCNAMFILGKILFEIIIFLIVLTSLKPLC